MPVAFEILKATAVKAVAFFVLTGALQAQPVVQTTTTFYDVDGQTGAALRAQMKALGPGGSWGKTWWKVRWSSDCLVSVDITYTYPRLKDRQSVPSDVLANWDQMMQALIAHEEGHAAITIQSAERIIAADCKKASRLFKAGNRLNETYDEQTRHGRTQGVRLPNSGSN